MKGRFVTAVLSLLIGSATGFNPARAALPAAGNFSRSNLVAWCIVPFDTAQRTPAQRAAMLESLGISRLAYDWRNEHIPTFDTEIAELAKRRIELTAWWFPANLGPEARAILDCLARHKLSPQLWVTLGTEPETDPARLEAKISNAVATLGPICAEAARIGSKVGLYNHLGWFGEPTHQLTVLARLRAAGHTNVGVVYNFHHGHAHIDRFPELLAAMKPHLLAVNLNGMVWNGDREGRKIIPLGTGHEELRMLQALHRSGWRGPVGILGHTEEDAEGKLRKELAGLETLVARLGETLPPPPARPLPPPPPNPLPAATELLVDGQTPGSKALDARVRGLVTAGKPFFRSSPVTVRARVRLGSAQAFSIIAASETKASPTHWELYSYAGSGVLALYQPGATPAEIRTDVVITDGRWHAVEATLEEKEVTLTVDGRPVLRQPIQRSTRPDASAARFAIGQLVEGGLGCDGFIEEVSLRPGTGAVGAAEETFRFESLTDLDGRSILATTVPPDGGVAPAPASTRAINREEPWKQGEGDWVDDRWNQTTLARWQAYYLPTPAGTVRKGLAIRVGENSEGAVCYDTATGNWRLAWTGGFLKFDPARFGLLNAPRSDGRTHFVLSGNARWTGGDFRWHRFGVQGDRVALEYSVGGVVIRESPWAAMAGPHVILARDIEVAPSADVQPALTVLEGEAARAEEGNVNRSPWYGYLDGDDLSAVLLDLRPGLQVLRPGLTNVVLNILPRDQPLRLRLMYYRGPKAGIDGILASVSKLGRFAPVGPALTQGSAPALPPIPVKGQLGPATDAYAIDTIPVPYENPTKSLLFCSGVGFFDNGDAAVATLHGDVWRVSGLDAQLASVEWKRIATGLFQPLGLTVVSNVPVVLCRDHLTRLIDQNGDGVTDVYESLCSQIQTSGGGHDYVTSLERDNAGNFYYVDPQGAHRISPDGRQHITLAKGFRNANGLGVSPDGTIVTVAPQQGEWTPSSVIHELRNGGWYGYGGPRVTPERPLGYDLPLCWIPHRVDNSSGSQVWAMSDRFGPLSNQLLHLSWGRCTLLLTLRDVVDGTAQGAVVPLKGRLLSGPMRGAIRPQDGQLYVVGCQGWQTAAARDGSFQRVRWTGKKLPLPVAWKATTGSLRVTFNEPLDRETVVDPGSYALEAWNYRYAAAYGSKDWSVKNPDREGHDTWEIQAATLEADGRTVVLQVPDLKPVMQFSLKYNLDTASRAAAAGELYGTIHKLHPR